MLKRIFPVIIAIFIAAGAAAQLSYTPPPHFEKKAEATPIALCGGDADCVTKHPEICPDENTLPAYRSVWGWDSVIFTDDLPVSSVPLTLQGNTWIPEEGPNGGQFEQWFDNSPHYTDGYTLLVNDATHTMQWRYDGQAV